MTRAIFMGTPDFAVPSLNALVAGAYQMVAVVTQPDRPSGRGLNLEPLPVKAAALKHGLLVLQPATLRTPEAVAELAALKPEVIVVAAFGQILRPAVLDLPRFGCVNVHASLLPRWRGAAPVQAALLAGDLVTGSTVMLMDPGMDTGPILAQAAMLVQPGDNAGSLTERLARQGADLLADTLPRWIAGEVTPLPQDNQLATICRPVRKEQGRIDWARPAAEIAQAVAAFTPWPGASTTWNGLVLKVLAAAALPGQALDCSPGTVMALEGDYVVVTGDGSLRLDVIQLAGRNAVAIADFVRGQRSFVGSHLGA